MSVKNKRNNSSKFKFAAHCMSNFKLGIIGEIPNEIQQENPAMRPRPPEVHKARPFTSQSADIHTRCLAIPGGAPIPPASGMWGQRSPTVVPKRSRKRGPRHTGRGRRRDDGIRRATRRSRRASHPWVAARQPASPASSRSPRAAGRTLPGPHPPPPRGLNMYEGNGNGPEYRPPPPGLTSLPPNPSPRASSSSCPPHAHIGTKPAPPQLSPGS